LSKNIEQRELCSRVRFSQDLSLQLGRRKRRLRRTRGSKLTIGPSHAIPLSKIGTAGLAVGCSTLWFGCGPLKLSEVSRSVNQQVELFSSPAAAAPPGTPRRCDGTTPPGRWPGTPSASATEAQSRHGGQRCQRKINASPLFFHAEAFARFDGCRRIP
jgi:hypothetical protein